MATNVTITQNLNSTRFEKKKVSFSFNTQSHHSHQWSCSHGLWKKERKKEANISVFTPSTASHSKRDKHLSLHRFVMILHASQPYMHDTLFFLHFTQTHSNLPSGHVFQARKHVYERTKVFHDKKICFDPNQHITNCQLCLCSLRWSLRDFLCEKSCLILTPALPNH